MLSAEAVQRFPFLQGELGEAFAREALPRVIPRGTLIYDSTGPCPFVPFLLEGTVRVYKLGESGREITLYRVGPGQTCSMSTSCSMTESRFPAFAEAETDVRLLGLPPQVFRTMVRRHPELQAFVTATMARNMAAMMGVLDEVAFRRLDLRLVERLLRETEGDAPATLRRTHAELAVELGSVREVVSRILKDLERRGYIRLGRRRVEVLDRLGLGAHRERLLLGEGAGGGEARA